MASKYWIKLYHEILNDPKMGALPDNLWRRAIELFLLAGELEKGGELLDTAGIAWSLRLPCNETLQKELQALQERNILTLQDNGIWLVTHFSERQKKVDVAERVRKFRERERKKAESEQPSGVPKKDDRKVRQRPKPVTKRYIEEDKELISPNGDSGKPQVDSQKWNNVNKKIVGDKFFELTHLKKPTNKKTVGAWWGWLYEIFEIAGKDAAETCQVMGTVVSYMKEDHLSITSPKSLINLARGVASGQELVSKNGNQPQSSRASPKTLTDIDHEKLKRLQEGLE